MVRILRYFREVIDLVRLINEIADEHPEKGIRKYGYLFTNRSFLVPAVTLLINFLILVNASSLVPALAALTVLPPEMIVERIIGISTAIALLWSVLERLGTTAGVIFSKRQAKKKLGEVSGGVIGSDKLSDALRQALLT